MHDPLAKLKANVAALPPASSQEFDNQWQEMKTALIVDAAVKAADDILTEMSVTADDIEYYTAAFLCKWAEKAQYVIQARMRRIQFLEKFDAARQDVPSGQSGSIEPAGNNADVATSPQ